MPDQLDTGPTGYAVGWFSLSLINAGLAQGKGRSGLNWWLLSIFLGPIATFLVVVFPPLEPGDPADTQEPVSPILLAVAVGAIVVILATLGMLMFARAGV